jgi:AcrR family transcriptional regulator
VNQAQQNKEVAFKGRERMLEEARKLFWIKGFSGTSVRDIAQAYGCKPANVYNFFPSKEAILFEVFKEEMDDIIEPIKHLENDESGDPVEQLRLIIKVHLMVTLSFRRTAKTLFDVALDNLSPPNRAIIVGMRDQYDRILRAVIRRGQEQNIFAPCDAKIAGFLIANMITRCRIWFHQDQGLTVDELAEFIYAFTLKGLFARLA